MYNYLMSMLCRKPFLWVITLFAIMGTACTNSPSPKRPKLLIATAANMQYVMQELMVTFGVQNNIDCEMVLSSSGKLTAQIKEGAPYDVFVSANMKYPKDVEIAGKALKPPKVYAYGSLVLWTLNSDIEPELDLLSKPSVNHIALANPQTAPYGQAALEVLTHFKLEKEVLPKLVYGESIAQTNQFIHSRSVEIGFTSKSTVLSEHMKGEGSWIDIDENTYSPIEQGIVLIKQPEKDQGPALKFYNFMFSQQAKNILTEFGYQVSE